MPVTWSTAAASRNSKGRAPNTNTDPPLAHKVAELLRRLLRPTVWVTAERAFAEFFFLALFVIQAPILGPSAFGLIAAVMVFVAFWEQVPGHAAVEALLSVRDIETLHYSTVTAASVLACLAFAVLLFAVAGPLAAAFGNTELIPITRVMSVVPVLQAFSIAPLAAAQSGMRFQSTTLRTIVSLLAGGITGLALALHGSGAWALVWQAIVQRAVAAIVLWLAVPIPFGFALSGRHLREIAGFAQPIMLSRIMGWASGPLPRLILGLFLGSTDLGLFTLASRLHYIVQQVAMVPKMTVARVDLRRFADARETLGTEVRKMFSRLSMLSFPTCIGGVAIVPTLFNVWLDRRWHGALIPSQLMLLACIPYVSFYGSSALLYALNLQKWEAGVTTVLSVGGMVAVAVGGPFGLVASSAAIGILALATVPLSLLVIRRKCGLSASDILMPQAPAFIASCIMGLLVSRLRQPLEASFPGWVALGMEILAGAACYAGLMTIFYSRRTRQAIDYLRPASVHSRR